MSEVLSRTVIIEPISLPKGVELTDVFRQVSHTDLATLLDSAGSQQDSRYSVMLWSPFKVIRTFEGSTTSHCLHTGEVTPHQAAPFSVIASFHRAYYSDLVIQNHSNTDAERLPFVLGVAGFAGYDVGRCYESLPCMAKADYHCADMAVGCFAQSLIQDNQTGEVFHCRFATIPPLDQTFLSPSTRQPGFSLTSQWQSNLSKQDYTHALTKIAGYLRAGDCYQVNMAQRFSATYTGDEFTAYQALRTANKAPFSAFIRSQDSAVLSISPERFISVSAKGNVQTKPIKGTRPRSQDPAEDQVIASELLTAEKDRAENLMIVDLLRNDISKHSEPNSVHVPSLFALESFPAVHHLVSTVTAKLAPDSTPFDLLAGAFPGGSITGAPKVRAMEIIDELEPHRRNIYCGSVFYVGMKNDMDSSICIRTLLAEANRIHCWAGGGIVLDSEADSEYQETLDKVARILPVLEVVEQEVSYDAQ